MPLENPGIITNPAEFYMPTVEACNDFKVNRLPANYSSRGGVPTASAIQAVQVQDITRGVLGGPQYTRLGDLGNGEFWRSKQTMQVPPYNTRDIIIDILGNQPYTIKTVQNADGTITSEYDYGSGGPPKPQATFFISPTEAGGNPFEMEFNHEHDWNAQGDLFSTLLAKGSELVGEVENLITKTKNVIGKQGDKGFQPTLTRRADVAETYQGTKKQEFSVPFTLFTKGGSQNFDRDILGPLMALVKYSYPKRSKDFAKTLGALADKVLPGNVDPTSEKALDAINSINPGFRVYISEPPAYINVRDGAGLFSYKNCFIKSVKYKFKHFVDGTGRPPTIIEGSTSNLITHRNGPTAVPCLAECVLTIGTTEPLFSDDFIANNLRRSSILGSAAGITRVVQG